MNNLFKLLSTYDTRCVFEYIVRIDAFKISLHSMGEAYNVYIPRDDLNDAVSEDVLLNGIIDTFIKESGVDMYER